MGRPGTSICVLVPVLQTVASKLHGTEVQVEILKSRKECDHVQFLITEQSGCRKVSRPEIAEIETLSIGECTRKGSVCTLNCKPMYLQVFRVLLMRVNILLDFN